MKKLFVLLLLLFSASSKYSKSSSFADELSQLDKMLDMRSEYFTAVTNDIEHLKLLEKASLEYVAKYDLNAAIAEAYLGIQCDSLIKYRHRALNIAETHNDFQRIAEAKIFLARAQLKCGLYEEAIITLHSIQKKHISEELQTLYYWTFCGLYRNKNYITKDRQIALNVFLPKARMYRDSLSSTNYENSRYFYDIIVDNFMSDGNHNDIISISEQHLNNTLYQNTHPAILWYNIAMSKRAQGDSEGEMHALINSAKADIIHATKDHASLHEIAQILFKDGDIERSARYMQICMDDAMYFNANLRGIQIGKTLPVVIQAYNQRNHRQIVILYILASIISLLLIACVFSLAFSNKQRKQLSHIRKELENANVHLSNLNQRLQESDYLKENYVAYFIKQNSDYISKTHDLIIKINKNLRKGKINEALALTSLTDYDKDDISTFYASFDEAFLSIFPDFVEKFNELIKDEYKYPSSNYLNGKKTLSSELRVYALIRLGFNDSATLAELLRYSINSIYNIRSKAKSKSSVPKEDFEDSVRKISVL